LKISQEEFKKFSWDKAMAFLDFRKVKQQDEIKKLTPLEKPVIRIV
jgi:hypothetical protein